VQHDGGGRRYLVACPSAIIFAVIIFEGHFPTRWPLRIHLARPNEIGILPVADKSNRSAPGCMGVMTVREERQGSRAISSFALLEQHR